MKIRKILVMALALTVANGITAPFAAEMPYHSFAANDEDTNDIGKLGDNVTWTLDSEGTLTISGKGAISDYTDGDAPFANNEQIKNVIIDEGITHIGNYVFSSCHNIQSIELPKSLTGIGEYVFENCSSLTNIDIPDSVTSIGQYAFSGTAVKSIVIPESVVTLDTNSMFMDCKQLESVVLPQSVTAIYSNAFKNCIKLKEVDIPDSVTAIQNDVFSGTAFTSLFIPSGVTMINGNALRDSKIDTIYGFKDSASETFAKKNGLDFVESDVRIWKRTDCLPIAGVYKLECDVDVKNYMTISGMLDLDLNGHTAKIPEIICNSTSNVIIRDSDPQKEGTMICTEDRNLITSYNKLTIYGGSFYGYDKKTVCATVRINDGSFDCYGGEITGYYSHALSVRTKDGIINLKGGTLKASSAENGKNNVYSVWLADTFAGTLNITGGELHSDIGAAVSGSPSDCIVNISGGKILSDHDYGLKCTKNSTVNLSGDISIKGEKSGIYVPNGMSVNITGAITDADVSVYAEASGVLTNGLGKYISTSTVKRYLPNIKVNGTLSVNDEGELVIDVPDITSTTTVSGSATSTTTAASTSSVTSTVSTTYTTTSTDSATSNTTSAIATTTNNGPQTLTTFTTISSKPTTTSTITSTATTTSATTTAITSKATNDKRYIGTWTAYAYSDYENAPKKDLSNESVSFTLFDDMTGIMFNFGAERKAELTWANESNDCITVNWKGNIASFNYSNDELVFKRINGKIYYFVKEYSLGDVNGDNYINAVDASSVLSYYAMISTNKDGGYTEEQKLAADVNNDGQINAVDASCILSYYAYVSTTKEDIMSISEFMKK
jgi:hypothetical protein